MANIIGLALKVTGDASGLAKSLTPVDRALDKLAAQAEKATAVFQPFADKTAAAGAAQEQFASKFESLAKRLADGSIGAEDYAAAFGKLSDEAKASAAAFEEGLRVTAQVRTEEERRAEELGRLQELLQQGAISQETFTRASDAATGAEKKRADAAAAAARIIAANLTPQEKYDNTLQELTGHLNAGRLTQEQFNRAAAKARADLEGVGSEAAKANKNIDSLNNNVSILARIEIGRLFLDSVRALGNAFTSVTSQVTSLIGPVNASLDTLNDFSARTGIGVEALQGYAVAAKLAGVDTEQFGTAIQKLSVNIGKATPGDALDKSLRGINLSVKELRALAPEQQFSVIGEAISQLPTAADRAAIAVEIFGKQGAALAPLFREGADSITELQARAERLGMIVSETQVENVASMNDGFDLVRSTIEGIIGQVIGNLAPAVTAVTDEFLKFVEEWSGSAGQGGTGIANAITDVLLQGAEYFANIFDEFVVSFTEWLPPLSAASTTFDVASQALTAVTEVLRGLFNGFQLAVNGLIIGMGKILEGLGGWVSDDLEAFGKGLSDYGKQAANENIKNINEAASNAAQAVTSAFSGGNATPEAAGAGAAEGFMKGLRERIERERSPQFQIETNIEKTRERFDSFFGGVVDQSSAVTDAMRGFEAAVADVEDPLKLNAEEIQRIKSAQDAVNEAITKEVAQRQEARDASAKQAEEDEKRIAALTKTNDAQAKFAEDIAVIEREQARVGEQLAAARAAEDSAASDAAATRLAQLDQLQAKLSDQQRASQQGFSDGFAKAFESTNKGISDLIEKTQQFGTVGAMAAERLRNGVEAAQSQAQNGILTKEAYDREVAKQQDIFNQRLQGAQRVEQYLWSQLDERQQTELQYAAQLEARKTEAIENVKAIEDRIAAEQEDVEKARERGDLRSAKTGTQRIKQLRQAAAVEKEIAAAKAPRQQNGQFGGGLQSGAGFGRNFLTNVEAEQQQQVARSQSQALQSVNNSLASVARANAEMARRAELSRPVQGTVATADIRTAEGAALVLGLGATAQDPQLIEARLQTKQLGLIRQAIVGATAGYRNTPAEIY